MALLAWGQPDGGVTQFAYFVEDIEAAAADFTARLGVGPWFVRGPFQPDARLRGEPNQPVISLARGFSGHAMFELVQQHDDGPSVFHEHGGPRHYGFHHWAIVTSRFGLRLMTIREDEVAAEAMGIDTLRYKLYAFLLSAAAPGIVGGLSARDQGYIEPISVFPLIMTITMIVMALFGGKGTIWGPVLGAVVLFIFQEAVWARFVYLHQLLFGAIIVAVVLMMPRGILGVLQQKYNLPRTI